MATPNFKLKLAEISSQSATVKALETSIQSVVDSFYEEIGGIVTGLLPAGEFDARSGHFPSGALHGSYYITSSAGVVDGEVFSVGDWLIPLIDNASPTSFEGQWTRGDYSKVVARVYDNPTSLFESLEPARGPNALWQTKRGFKYVEATPDATDHHRETAAGIKLYVRHQGNRVPAEAFGVVGDGITDDIIALESWAAYIEGHGVIGVLDGKTYMVSRTLYLTGRGGYEGCEDTVIKATAGFAISFTDPANDNLAAGRAPVVFYDGRKEAVTEPTREPHFYSIKTDGGGVAAHGLMLVGVLPVTAVGCRAGNTTLERFVMCGLQNATITAFKAEALTGGLQMSDSAAWAILNGMKNSQLIGCDITGVTADAEAVVRIGTDANYPGPGDSTSPIAAAPSLLQFIGGVWETQGDSEEPKRALYITHGDQIDLIGVNMAMVPTVAMIEAEIDVNNLNVLRGRSNGLGTTMPFLINEGRGTVIDRHYISNFNTTDPLIVNNGKGRVFFTPADNGFFPANGTTAVFGGTAAHHQNHFLASRFFGSDEDAVNEWASSATGVSWWSAGRNHLEYCIDGEFLTSDGLPIPEGQEDVNSWPVFTDADITTGVLDVKGYPRVTLKLTSVMNIVGISAFSTGQRVSIVCDNTNPTFVSGSGLKMMDRANYTPQIRDVLVFERVNGGNLTGGTSEWVQTGGPCAALFTEQ